MVNKPIDRHQRLENFLQAVEVAQKLQDNILKYRLNAAYLYYQDVDGDWLEKWGEGEDGDTVFKSIANFLESDDIVAVKVRKLLQDKTIPEIASELEKSLSALEEENRVFCVKDLLINSVNNNTNNINIQDSTRVDNNNGLNLLNLAQELVDKLEEILERSAI